MHEYDVKLPNFTFYENVNIRRRISISLFKFGYSTTGELANNRKSDRVAKMALKFQRTRGHFLSDVFVAVTRKIKHHVHGRRQT